MIRISIPGLRSPFRTHPRTFTLQWHLTQRCAYSCRHCYDRSTREEFSLSRAVETVDEFQSFCATRNFRGSVSLSGGDPLLHPHFQDLYAHLARCGMPVSILGNPIPAGEIARLLAIQRPLFYQVSLEGHREHNDSIRGRGHYDSVMIFLQEARSRGLETHVMLTLTRSNLDQVISLGHALRGMTARFTFNRLSRTGAGADLELPDRKAYAEFLQTYLRARRSNPALGLKDNLFNVLRHGEGLPLLPGCTGAGCGAASNFVALLPDGEVHACRKFPSLLGNLTQAGLDALFDSPRARRYREGAAECSQCRVRRSCGGCPAVTAGEGLDPLIHRDPYCFLNEFEPVQGEGVRE